jgi:hypothetical protein
MVVLTESCSPELILFKYPKFPAVKTSFGYKARKTKMQAQTVIGSFKTEKYTILHNRALHYKTFYGHKCFHIIIT